MKKLLLCLTAFLTIGIANAQFTDGLHSYTIVGTDAYLSGSTATGDVTFPETANDGGTTYNVTGVHAAFNGGAGPGITDATFPLSYKTYQASCFRGLADVVNVTFIGGEDFGGKLFRNNGSLNSVVLPTTITAWGTEIFSQSSLSTIVLGNCPEINNRMFRDTNVTELILPATMTAISASGWNNSSVTTLFCEGSTPATIDAGWAGDATIMTAYVPDAAAVTAYGLADVWKDFAAILVVGNVGDTFSVADIDYRITSFGPNIEVEVAGSTLATPVIPSTVNNGGITYTVTAIGASAFKNNVTITSIELPVTVTNIDNAAFQAAANLSAVTFTTTSGIRNIALRGFLQCTSLTNVNEIISVLETIGGLGTNGNGTFNSCNITGTLTTPSTLTTSTATSIFRANHNMIVADLSASTLLTTLAGNFLFDNDGLTTVLLPPSLIELSASSVRDNPLLSSIIIPSTVTTYGTNVFKDNFAMLSVEVQNTAPVAIDASVFDSIDLSTATLTVPLGTTGDYDAAAVWTDFGTITDGATTLSTNNLEQELGFSIYPNPTSGVVSIISKQLNNANVSVYDLNGRVLLSKSLNGTSSEINISNLASGVYLLKVQVENSEFVKRIVKQ